MIIALIGAHLYLVVKLGTTAPPWLRADRKPKEARAEQVDASPRATATQIPQRLERTRLDEPPEKEEYLREYEVLKKKGKPFFPYAIMKDSVMALIVVLVIIVMSI